MVKEEDKKVQVYVWGVFLKFILQFLGSDVDVAKLSRRAVHVHKRIHRVNVD